MGVMEDVSSRDYFGNTGPGGLLPSQIYTDKKSPVLIYT